MYAFVDEYYMQSISASSVTHVYFLVCVLSYTLHVTIAAFGELGFAIFQPKERRLLNVNLLCTICYNNNNNNTCFMVNEEKSTGRVICVIHCHSEK